MAECVICLDSLPANLFRTTCNHSFHDDCIKKWLQGHTTCPFCRAFITFRYKEDYSIVVFIFLPLIMFVFTWVVGKTNLCENYLKRPTFYNLTLYESHLLLEIGRNFVGCNYNDRFYQLLLEIGSILSESLDVLIHLCKKS